MTSSKNSFENYHKLTRFFRPFRIPLIFPIFSSDNLLQGVLDKLQRPVLKTSVAIEIITYRSWQAMQPSHMQNVHLLKGFSIRTNETISQPIEGSHSYTSSA